MIGRMIVNLTRETLEYYCTGFVDAVAKNSPEKVQNNVSKKKYRSIKSIYFDELRD